jgi:hypothetical protein
MALIHPWANKALFRTHRRTRTQTRLTFSLNNLIYAWTFDLWFALLYWSRFLYSNREGSWSLKWNFYGEKRHVRRSWKSCTFPKCITNRFFLSTKLHQPSIKCHELGSVERLLAKHDEAFWDQKLIFAIKFSRLSCVDYGNVFVELKFDRFLKFDEVWLLESQIWFSFRVF